MCMYNHTVTKYVYITVLIDINECKAGNHGCPVHSVCKNTMGSFECVCIPGLRFSKSQGRCEGIIVFSHI